jgi:hypothetical protein
MSEEENMDKTGDIRRAFGVPRRIIYSCDPNAEEVTEQDPDEEIERFLSYCKPGETPSIVTAYAWVPIEITDAEKLAFEEVTEAAREFVDFFSDRYVPTALERAPAHDVTVDAVRWITEHAPEWLR